MPSMRPPATFQWSTPGPRIVQFSPSEELQKTEEVMAKNMQAMQGGGG